MAAQRTPLGHKRRGEAALAFSPKFKGFRMEHAKRIRAAHAGGGFNRGIGSDIHPRARNGTPIEIRRQPHVRGDFNS